MVPKNPDALCRRRAYFPRRYAGKTMGEGRMLPRVDKSVTVMTGMIVAGLYSILLIGVTRESYMKRDAAARDVAPRFELASARTEGTRTEGGTTVAEPVSKRTCLPEHPLCATLFDHAAERQNCAASVEVLRRLLGETAPPLTIEALRQMLRVEP
jgi:hypothetical protein